MKTGVILEMMEAACGGRQGFERAKEAGRVWSYIDEEGNELWYAKSSEVADETGIREAKTTKKTQQMTDEQYEGINKLVAGLGWDIPSKTKALEDIFSVEFSIWNSKWRT
eukprot:8102449-Karenia_brevis.AAC.1